MAIGFRGGGRVRGGRVSGRGHFRVSAAHLDFHINPNWPKDLYRTNRVRQLFEDMAEVGERAAWRRAPGGGTPGKGYATGEMADTIEGKVETLDGELYAKIVVGTGHWAFVEYGTGLRGAGSVQPGKMAQGYRHGMVLGMEAQPFMRPALYDIRAWVHSGGAG